LASDFEYVGTQNGIAGFRDKITSSYSRLPNPTEGVPELLDGDEVALDDGMGGYDVWSIQRGEKLRRR
jgi:hypothetical protein